MKVAVDQGSKQLVGKTAHECQLAPSGSGACAVRTAMYTLYMQRYPKLSLHSEMNKYEYELLVLRSNEHPHDVESCISCVCTRGNLPHRPIQLWLRC